MKRAALAAALTLAATHAFAWGRASAPDWLKAAVQTPLTAVAKDAPAVCLFDVTSTTVAANGEISTTYRGAFRILSTEGRDLAYAGVPFDSLTRLESFRAWSIAPNGDEYEVKDKEANETSQFDGVLYSDVKMKWIKIPAADPGTVFGYEWATRQPQPQALQDIWHFQQNVPVQRARYALVLPPGWTHEERWINGAAKSAQNGVWEVTDIPAVKDEEGSPPFAAVAGRLALNFLPPSGGTVLRNWADLGRWYARLAEARRAPTPALQTKVRELTASASTTWDKMRALALFAQRDVRYVAIEIGIGGYQPHAAGEIFANRYGDCKDKVTALSSMLKEIGVESYYVITTTYRGLVDKQFASMAGFNHAIIAIRVADDVKSDAVINHPKLGRLLIFDPTDEYTPLGRLPWYAQGNVGLLVTPDGGELIDLPAQQPETNKLVRTAKLKLHSEGSLAGSVTEVRSGTLAAIARARIGAMKPSERQKFIETSVAFHLADFKITDLAIENLDDLDKDLVVRYTLITPRYAKVAGNLVLVRPRVLGRKAENMIDLKERQHGYQTDGPSVQIDEVEIATPAGLVIDELPPPAKIATPALAYTSEAKFENDTLRYRREYRVQALDVPLAGLPELNKAFAQIVADERGSAVFKNR